MNQTSSNNLPVIGGIVAISVLLFGGLVWLLTRVPSSQPPVGGGPVVFSDEGAPRIGPADAKVTVQIYGDFQCPACRAAEPALKLVMDKYKDRVAFVWKDFPLMSIHPNARPAANAARCAEAQGKFWEYHDSLYDAQNSWASLRSLDDVFATYAKNLGLDEAAFRACYASRTYDDKVMAGVNEGSRNSVDRTPTYFIGDRRVFGMAPAEWYGAIDAALASAPAPAPVEVSAAATSTEPGATTSTLPGNASSTP